MPVNVGEASGALRSSAACAAVLTGLAVSAVLSTLPRPTIVLVTPVTVPVNAGDASGALRSSAACAAVLTGLAASEVLSTLPRTRFVRAVPAFVISDKLFATFKNAVESSPSILSALRFVTFVVLVTVNGAVPSAASNEAPKTSTLSTFKVLLASL